MTETLPSPQEAAPTSQATLAQLALVFLRLGTTAFGGPAAHIAMMEDEFVKRHRWLSQEAFLDLLGAANLIPGPSSTELAIYIGYRQRGWPGLIVSGCSFIIPAATIVMTIAWAYVRFGSLPQISAILYGVKPIIIGIVVQALWRLGRTALKTKLLMVIGLLAIILNFYGVNILIVLFGAGIFLGIWQAIIEKPHRGKAIMLPYYKFIDWSPNLSMLIGSMTEFSQWKLFLFFLKVGSVLFGSGYVLLAFLRADLVEHWHWLTEAQLLDAIAVGQVTPGPVFTTATFIGYLLGGPGSAIIATIGIFLPSFILVAISGPLIPRLRKSPIAGAFLDGVNVASLALMFVVTCQLGRTTLIDFTTITMAIVSILLLLRFELNSAWLVLAGAIIGLVIRSF